MALPPRGLGRFRPRQASPSGRRFDQADRFSTRTLVLMAGAVLLATLAFVAAVTRSTPGERLARSIDRAAARTDRLETDIDALSSRVPTTTAPPPTFRVTTTSSPVSAPAPATTAVAAPTVALSPATREQIEAVVTTDTWDFHLPLPAEGLASASFSPTQYGGTLSYTTAAPAADTATFLRSQLAARGFVSSESRAGEQYTFLLGDQGRILVGPAGARAAALMITMSL